LPIFGAFGGGSAEDVVILHAGKIIYRSTEEAIRDLRELLPLLEVGKIVAGSGKGPPCPPGLYHDICRILELLRDDRALAEHLTRSRRNDGSIEFRFSGEAWAMLGGSGGLDR
jgi:hypothetical protein